MDDRQRAFRAWVAAVWSRDERVESVENDGDEFALRVSRDSGTVQVFLTNLFHEVRELDEEGKAEQVLKWLDVMVGFGGSEEEGDEVTILPVLRAASFVASVELAALSAGVGDESKPKTRLLYRPFLPGLCALLAFDSEKSFKYVMEGDLPTEIGTIDEAFEEATGTLSDAETVWSTRKEPAGTMMHMVTQDSYEASRLLVPGFLASLAPHVEGRPVAIVPERDQLIVAGDHSDSMIARLCETASAEWEASPRSISPALYTVDDDGNVVEYWRDGEDSLAQAVRLGHVKLALEAASRQKEYLEALHEKQGQDLFVASLHAYRREADGRVFTVGMWGREIDALLPVCDLVDVVGDDEGSYLVHWRDMIEVAGSHFTDAGLFPKRLLVSGWADEATMAKLRERAVTLETA
jgi:uncharacterized protein YtpQ (UPF0354 family)